MLLLALLSGFLLAFFGSMPPVGPIAVLVLERALFGRYREGLDIAIGAALPEGIYSALAVFGLSVMFERFPAVNWLARVVSVLVLLMLGVHFTRFKAQPERASADAHGGAQGSRRSFLLGFSVAAANPFLIVTWSTSVAMLYSLGGFRFDLIDKVAFALAVAAGVVAWFSTMLALLRRLRDQVTLRLAVYIVRGAGIAMVAMALFFAGSLVKRTYLP